MASYTFMDAIGRIGHLDGELTPEGNLRITREQAEALLNVHGSVMPFDIMSGGYGGLDSEDYDPETGAKLWTGLDPDDLDEHGHLDPDWEPFEIWAPDVQRHLTEEP